MPRAYVEQDRRCFVDRRHGIDHILARQVYSDCHSVTMGVPVAPTKINHYHPDIRTCGTCGEADTGGSKLQSDLVPSLL